MRLLLLLYLLLLACAATPAAARITEPEAEALPPQATTLQPAPDHAAAGADDPADEAAQAADASPTLPPTAKEHTDPIREELHEAPPATNLPVVEAEGRIPESKPHPVAAAVHACYRTLIYRKLDIGLRSMRHSLDERNRGEPFDESFIGSIDQLRIASESGIQAHVVLRYAPIPYIGIGYQQDRLAVRTQTSLPRSQRATDRDTDGNMIMQASMPFVFVRYPWRNFLEPYLEYGQARFSNHFDPDPRWYADGRREFVLEDSDGDYWGLGVGILIREHFILDAYVREIETHVDGTYFFRGDDRDPEPFVFPATHRAYGISALLRF